jgi:hypothetical protein
MKSPLLSDHPFLIGELLARDQAHRERRRHWREWRRASLLWVGFGLVLLLATGFVCGVLAALVDEYFHPAPAPAFSPPRLPLRPDPAALRF